MKEGGGHYDPKSNVATRGRIILQATRIIKQGS